MRNAKPLISIGVPTYNRAASLKRAVESALAQDYPNLEFVISDNASTDQTEAICKEWSRRDPRVRYIRQPVNQGIMKNFRTVLEESRGEFYMWLADDDWLASDYVSQCAEIIERNPEYELVSGSAKYYLDGEFRYEEYEGSLEEARATERVLSFYRRVLTNGTFYGIMRRRVIIDLPFPDILAGDWLFVSYLAFLGKTKMLSSIYIHRSAAGVSENAATLTSHLGISGFRARNIYWYIAFIVFRDIMRESPVFKSMGFVSRTALALRAAAIVISRHDPPGWYATFRASRDALQRRLILRTRLRLFINKRLNKDN